jgi:hypothetical protein
MTQDGAAVTGAYLQHLTDADVQLLAGGPLDLDARRLRDSLRSRRGGIEDLMVGQQVFESVFGDNRHADPLLNVSPFLVFAIAIERTVRGLDAATYVDEWAGVGRRMPVFDVARLRELVSSPWWRLFLAELLASFSHVASGSVIVATRRGWRRQRFSELDPVRLAGLLDVVTVAERPGVLRRLGDVALFLTAVFPDHMARRGFGPVEEGRLVRSAGPGFRPGHDHPERRQAAPLPGDDSPLQLLEQLGRRWYRAAYDLMPRPVPSDLAVVAELPDHFGDARRILALATERFLFPYRDRWFGVT